ncbi:hypothetical protein B566_EDAN007988 [Ephemera danica]|nr:hypothetical protein B566_EDAN007988 [Ephemera danica]
MCASPNLAIHVKMISFASSLYDGIEDNDLRQIKYLLETKKADPNVVIPNKGICPLHFIAGSKPETFAIEVTKLFLLHGGDPNVRSVEGATPVHIASAWGQENLLRLLLDSGGDPALVDDDGLTPLDYAAKEDYFNIIDMLKDTNEPVNFNRVSDSDHKFCLTLEKVVIDEGEFLAEYQMRREVETKTVSTPTESDSPEDTVVPMTSLSCVLPEISEDESWTRVAHWCEEQSQFMETTPVIIKTEPNSSHYLSVKENLMETVKIKTEKEFNASPMKSSSENCSSEAFYTCESNFHTASSHKTEISPKTISSLLSSAVSEVYRYSDKKYGIVLIEKRLPISSATSCTEISDGEIEICTPKLLKLSSRQERAKDIGSCGSTTDLPSERGYCTDELRRELNEKGFPLGPITRTTKRVYIKQLFKLRKSGNQYVSTPEKQKYSRELERTMKDLINLDLAKGLVLEQLMAERFVKTSSSYRWREGVAKSSFTYLLLDPRITCNLPLQGPAMRPLECWRTFVQSIFYVGKGKRSRPYSHLYEAVDVWNGKSRKSNKKIDHILSIWKDNQGVVCLHIFQNVIPVEAYTREAAMIDALGLSNVCNQKRGEYYGVMASQSPEQRRHLGVYLLYRALHILLHEGERQLQPLDIL